MTPRGRIRLATKVALRRRYGYAALKALRRGVRKAWQDHKARQVDPSRPYSTSSREMIDEYWRALRRLRKKWPDLDPSDPRAEIPT